MTLSLPRLSLHKGSSLKERISIKTDENESLVGVRSAAYLKVRGSDNAPLVSLETKLIDGNIEIAAPSSSLSQLIVGVYSYYVELISGRNKIVEKGYLSIEP